MSSLTVWLLSMTRGIRRRRNAAELARIEPVHAAPLAGVDDDIARSAVHLVDHGLAARRTLQVSLARRLAARWQGLNRPRFVKPRGVDHRSKPAHLNQHPEAPRAAEQRHGVHPTFCQRRRAERAPPVRRLEQFHGTRERRATPARCRSGRTSGVPLPFASTPRNSRSSASRHYRRTAQERRSRRGREAGEFAGLLETPSGV